MERAGFIKSTLDKFQALLPLASTGDSQPGFMNCLEKSLWDLICIFMHIL